MPNIKSQKKRVITNNKANEINSAKRTRVRNAIKAFKIAVEQNDVATAEKLLPETVSIINAAKSDGIYHENNASRKIARLNIMLNKIKG